MRLSHRGFTLIELICVMAIMVLLMAVSLPSLLSIANQAGRHSAINQVLGVFDQSRVAALQSGLTTHLVFADNTVPYEGLRFRAYIVVREATEEEIELDPTRTVVPLTKWTKLPKGISFSASRNTLFDPNAPRTRFDGLPGVKGRSLELPSVTFSSAGTVLEPAAAQYRKFFIYEGAFDGQGDSIRERSDYAGSIYDTFHIARFTGRLQLETEDFNTFMAQTNP